MKSGEKAVELDELHRRNQMLENLLAALRASGDSPASQMRHKLVEVPGCSLDMRTGRLRVLGDLVELADARQLPSQTEPKNVSNGSQVRLPRFR
ncbi:hypothetical protein L596_019223 [Steinernema carpocapsae]|uniref:Uncharacterized protein n=1 Tax=Steinernema carpocapsae TaxID=34508 RepID=A0A4U5MPU6_STECR|nr:hypothetical protein L596_019223 [Steinernema carpocapsae]